MTPASAALAVWTALDRTLTVGTPGAPTTRAEEIAEAVWEYVPRTLTGGPVTRGRSGLPAPPPRLATLLLPGPIALADHSLNAGRLAWWLALPATSGGAQLYDLVGANHASLASKAGTVWAGTTRPGGTAQLTWDGSSYLGVPSTLSLASRAQFTIAAWVYRSATNQAVNFSQSVANTDRVTFTVNASDQVQLVLRTGTTGTAGTLVGVGAGWHHVVAVYNGLGAANADRVKIYLDGRPGSLTFVGTIPAVAPPCGGVLRLGHDAGNNVYSSAGTAFDSLSLWDRSLSATEVAALYQDSRAGYPATLARRRRRTVLWLAGGTAYTETTTGGLACGGAIAPSQRITVAAVGGLISGGAVTTAQVLATIARGGLIPGGTTATTLDFQAGAAVGLRAGGAGRLVQDWTVLVAGGFTPGGTVTAGPASYRPTAAGGLISGGASTPRVAYPLATRGGLTPGGAAPWTMTITRLARGGLRLGGAVLGVTKGFLFGPKGGLRLGGRGVVRTDQPLGPRSGGLTAGGTSLPHHRMPQAATGGLSLGGTITLAPGYLVLARGGLRLSGHAAAPLAAAPPIAGGITVIAGASGVQVRGRITPAGGLALGGAVAWSGSAVATAGGGLRLGGPATVTRAAIVTPSGGIAVGAGAQITYFHYQIYANDGLGGPIDYTSPIGNTNLLHHTTAALSYPGTWQFAVRVTNLENGLQERNLDAMVTVILDASGADITNRPAPPRNLQAAIGPGGVVRLAWAYPPVTGGGTPTGFHVYQGTGAVSYAAAVATVAFAAGRTTYWADIAGLTDGVTYLFGIRAYNTTAEETNTTTVTAVADASAPAVIEGLTLVAG